MEDNQDNCPVNLDPVDSIVSLGIFVAVKFSPMSVIATFE